MAQNARRNPTKGEKRSDSNVSITLCQGSLTLESIIFITSETPRIEPISVCELDAGSPRYQVPKFQIIAAMRSESTTQTQNTMLELPIFSSGRSFMIHIATPVPPMITPKKLKNAANMTAFFGVSEFE